MPHLVDVFLQESLIIKILRASNVFQKELQVGLTLIPKFLLRYFLKVLLFEKVS